MMQEVLDIVCNLPTDREAIIAAALQKLSDRIDDLAAQIAAK